MNPGPQPPPFDSGVISWIAVVESPARMKAGGLGEQDMMLLGDDGRAVAVLASRSGRMEARCIVVRDGYHEALRLPTSSRKSRR